MRMMLRWFVWLVFSCACWSAASLTTLSAEPPDYLRDIKPLLAANCYACHGALKQEGGLRVDTSDAIKLGGDTGVAIKPTDSAESLIIARVSSQDASMRMPPEGKPLTEQQIALLSQWIAAGANAPSDEQPQADPRQHWAFQLPQASLPQASLNRDSLHQDMAGSNNPVDSWLYDKASKLGVEPLGQATKRELLRRATLDLTGLPPTIEDIQTFEADNSEDAYDRLIDSLLNRPEYGERWGRHWMDVWRYSDWYGRRAVPDVMNSYPQIWRWRDWIVRSLNEDKGYDRMLMEMVAADELCPTDDANVVATGFIVRNWYKWNYETWMKDSVEHTGKAFLGLTLNCAHCHDHKFDPITQADYFRFRAFFEPLELRHDRASGEPDPGPFKKYVYAQSYGPIKSGAIRIFDEKLDAQTFMFRGGDARNRIEGKPPVDCGPPKAFTPDGFEIKPIDLPAEAYYPGLKETVRHDEMQAADTALANSATALSTANENSMAASQQLVALQAAAAGPATATNQPAEGDLIKAQTVAADSAATVRIARAAYDAAAAKREALVRRIAADDAAFTKATKADELARLAHVAESQANHRAAEHARQVAEQALIVAERQLVTATAEKSAKLDEVKKAADATTKKLEAARTAADATRGKLATVDASYTPLSPKYPAQSTGRRTALAKWLVDRRNPLTARVAVNHIWMRHFGTPLVESVDNFGVQGKLPTHPELLDWLAVRLMESGWSMKGLHRLIMTSQAYQRASSAGSLEHPNFGKDRDNLCYWHYPVRRMEAEVVRDSVLACAGALDRTLGGPEIEVEQWVTRPRRSMYFTQHGESQMLFLSTFDGANPCECYRRSQTVLPSQALALTNSELLVHYGRLCATHLAKKLTASEIVDASTNLVDVSSQASSTAIASQYSAHEIAFVKLAFESLLGRQPTEEELRLSAEFLSQDRTAAQERDEAAEKTAGGIQPPAADPVQRARENLVMALFNHNDFVTVR